MLKIESVTLEGDPDGFVTAALKAELYAKGATRADKNGVKIIGKVTMSGSLPLYLSAEAEGQPFAGIASSNMLARSVSTMELASGVVDEFCRCREKSSALLPEKEK